MHKEGRVRCGLICSEADFKCGMSEEGCIECIACGGPEKGFEHNEFLCGQLSMHLRGRLLAGDAPRFQAANPVDMNAAVGTYRRLNGGPAARDLLKQMFRAHSARTEAAGGYPPAVVAQKIEALANANDMADVIDEIRRDYGGAGRYRAGDSRGS